MVQGYGDLGTGHAGQDKSSGNGREYSAEDRTQFANWPQEGHPELVAVEA
jgi:hypothetical protein